MLTFDLFSRHKPRQTAYITDIDTNIFRASNTVIVYHDSTSEQGGDKTEAVKLLIRVLMFQDEVKNSLSIIIPSERIGSCGKEKLKFVDTVGHVQRGVA